MIVDARASLDDLNRRFNLDLAQAGDFPDRSFFTGYRLVSREGSVSTELVGVALRENGAFGNCMVQYRIAVSVAQRLALRFIKIADQDRSEMIRITKPVEIDGLTFLPADHDLPDGVFLQGAFFDPGPFLRGIGGSSNLEAHEIIDRFVRPIFDAISAGLPKSPPADCLMIHIRSGDIFSTWVEPNYVQPPLAFYVLVIDRLRRQGRIQRARLVYENKLNPVIEELERYLRRIRFPFEVSSGSVVDDIRALMNGKYYTFGYGTFGPGICQLSRGIEEVYYFSPGIDPGFSSIPSVARAIEAVDIGGGYIKAGEWNNSPDQRNLMITYPKEHIAFQGLTAAEDQTDRGRWWARVVAKVANRWAR